MKTTWKKSWPVNHPSDNISGFCILLKNDAVPKIFPNLNVVALLVVPAGCGSRLPRLAVIFNCSQMQVIVVSELSTLFMFSHKWHFANAINLCRDYWHLEIIYGKIQISKKNTESVGYSHHIKWVKMF